MCSCSGSCNCNSTTIPRGPQGVPGKDGTNGTNGTNGAASTVPGPQGNVGPNGLNSFTTLTENFVQPAPNLTVEIFVVNNSWMAIDEIIFIGPSASTDAGGFYRVMDMPVSTSVEVMRMDWIIPDVAFEATGQAVGAVGTIVTPSGTIGPEGLIRKVLDETSEDATSQTTGATINNHLWTISDLVTNQDTISFEFTIAPFSGNGGFDDVRVTIGTTLVSRFRFSDDATVAAKIKFDTDPTDVPAGYISSSDATLSEDINLIKGVVKITRRSDFTISYDITYYMYNYFVQQAFTSTTKTRMLQKVFHTYGGHSVPQLSLSGLAFSFLVDPRYMTASDAFYGTDIQIYNAIKLSSIL